jgi:hypothetical protein
LNKYFATPFDEASLNLIFSSVMEWFFNRQDTPFSCSVITMKDNCVAATIALFQQV